MSNFKLGLQLYSVREDFVKDYEKTLKEVSKMGYEVVEFAGLYEARPEDIKKLCAELNIIPISAHLSVDLNCNDHENLILPYGKIGCQYVVVPWIDSTWLPGEEHFSDFDKYMGKISEVSKKLGMKLCYHNHEFELDVKDGKTYLDTLYEIYPEDVLQTELDLCWIAFAGYNPVKYLEKYKNRSKIVHIKDFYSKKVGCSREEAEFEFRTVGSGKLDAEAVLTTVKNIDCKYLIVEQDAPTPGKTPLECAAESIEFIKSKI
ncbi:MAG: sugar phosphate isomerase/epimerase [Ruminococcaceae bacterium]|nr:sugar phosphate isomerase/epimerase [Oscillospiraceae bacterium]